MAYEAVFFDIDGTLVTEAKEIPEDTRRAVKQLQDNGIDVFIATGRAPSQFEFIADELGIDSFVTCNGGYAEYKGHPVFGKAIEKPVLEALTEEACNSGHALVYAGSEACYATQENHPSVREAFDYLRIVKQPEYRPDAWEHTDIYQVYLYCEAPNEVHYMKKFSSMNFIRAHRVYLDLFPNNVSKAGGIEAMLRSLNLSREEAVAFGDGLNDVQMLSYVGMGIAMGNARDEVKSFANFTTRRVDDGGIVHGLKKIGLL